MTRRKRRGRWENKVWFRYYQNCKKKQKRGTIVPYVDCITRADYHYAHWLKEQLNKQIQQPTPQLSRLERQDLLILRRERLQPPKEKHIVVDKINIHVKKRDTDRTLDLW